MHGAALPLDEDAFSDSFRAWRAAGDALGGRDADALIAHVQSLVVQVVEARAQGPQHPALRRPGAAAALGLDDSDPRRALRALEDAERRAGPGSAREFLGDAARQDLLERLAGVERWGAPPPAAARREDVPPTNPLPSNGFATWPRPASAPRPLPLRDRLARRARAWTRQALDRAGLNGLI